MALDCFRVPRQQSSEWLRRDALRDVMMMVMMMMMIMVMMMIVVDLISPTS